jgi:hypothetical protein
VLAYGPEGVSNTGTFVVNDRPERPEAEPNDTPDAANPIQLGQTLDGRAEKAADVDCFAFEGRAGQRVVLELASRTLGSRLDGSIRLIGPDGAEIAEALETAGLDPDLDLTLPADGRYVARVQDVTYAGSPEHVYRLTLHDDPRVLAILPAAAALGTSSEFTLLGRGLGGEPAAGWTIDGRPLEARRVTLGVPAPDETRAPGTDFVRAPLFLGPGWRARPEAKANPLSILPATEPVVAEAEPNGPDSPQLVTPPCVISGTWGAPGDLDVYRFAARKGEVWRIEVLADRLGSMADPTLAVQQVTRDGTKDLSAADDLAGLAASVDAGLRLAVPEDGPYQVAAADLFGAQRGDVRFRYALVVRPERPDFRVLVAPGGPTPEPFGLSLRPGGRAEAVVHAIREDGFAGALRVEAAGLPPGVTCDPVTIGPGQNTAPLVFAAPPDAPPVVVPLTVVARSLSPDRKEVLSYTPGSSRVEPEKVRSAVPMIPLWAPSQAQQGGPPAPTLATRATNGLYLGVADSDAPFRLSAGPTEPVVAAGEAIELNVEVTRREGFAEAVQVATAVLPPNVGAANVAIAKEATAGTLKLNISKNAAPGTYTVLLRGTAPYNTGTGKRGGRRRSANAVEPSNTIQLRIIK